MYNLVGMYFNLCSKESQDSYEEIKKMILDIPWHIFDEKRSNVLASSLKYAINEEDSATVEFLSENFVIDGILSDEFVKQLDRIDIGIESDTAQEKFDQMIEMIDAKSDSLWIKQHARKKVSDDEFKKSLCDEVTFKYPNEDLI